MLQRKAVAFIFTMFILLENMNVQAQEVAVTLNVATAGTLSTLIDSSRKDSITNLKLTGHLNGTDILYIREMAGRDVNGGETLGALSVLNLSGTTIESGGECYYHFPLFDCYTATNEITRCMFRSCKRLTSIILPDSVTIIGNEAFNYCSGLTSISIPNSVTSINFSAFGDCTGLTSIIIPNGVTSIGTYAFQECSGLTSIIIPNSMNILGERAFSGCSGLTSATIGSGVTSINNYVFYGCSGLTSFVIPDGVTSIGDCAFCGCTGLSSIRIPQSVISVGEKVFTGCTGLTQIIADSNNSNFSSLDGVLFNKDMTLLIAYPLGKSTQYTIPGSVTSIGNNAFFRCTGLTSVTFGSGITSIGAYAFYGCAGLTFITIPDSVTSIGNGAFSNCKIATLNYNPVKSISIDSHSFTFQLSLNTLNIGENVKALPGNLFYYCSALKEIHCQMKTPPTIASDAFQQVNKGTCKLYVPQESSPSYRIAQGWSDFTDIIEEVVTPVNEIKTNSVTVYTEHNDIVIKGASVGETISVYTTTGTLVQTLKATNEVRINVPSNHIYLVKIAGKTFKVKNECL